HRRFARLMFFAPPPAARRCKYSFIESKRRCANIAAAPASPATTAVAPGQAADQRTDVGYDEEQSVPSHPRSLLQSACEFISHAYPCPARVCHTSRAVLIP